MEITSKQKILNLDLEQDSSEEDLHTNYKKLEGKQAQRFGMNIGGELKFNSNLIKPGIFYEEGDDYHNSAIMTFPQPELLQTKIEKKVQRKTRQIREEDKDEVKNKHKNIQILKQIEHENQIQENIFYETETEQNEKVQFQDISNVPSHLQVTSSIRQSILNINLDQNSSQSESDTNGEEYDYQSQTLRLLSLKPNEREKVTFEEIALTHDPYQNMLVFSDKKIPIGKIINLNIIRNQSGFNYLWPQFQLLYETGAPMLYSKKMMANTTSNYYISAKKDVSKISDPYFIAKLRGNFSGSVYQVYSKGINPKKGEVNKKIRRIEATIKFRQQTVNKQPREFQVYTLAANTNYHDLQGINFGQQLGLDQLFKNEKNKGKIFQFQNRKPIYSQAVQGFILNFGGRVHKASIKNFILQDSIAHREVLMLGKLEDDKFRVDVSWPLKPYVAYCVCLANFDSNFTSE